MNLIELIDFIGFSIGFTIGFFSGWIIGLTPALLYRFLVFKEPVPLKKACKFYLPVLILLMVAYEMTLTEGFGIKPHWFRTNWVLISAPGLWIMTRNRKI